MLWLVVLLARRRPRAEPPPALTTTRSGRRLRIRCLLDRVDRSTASRLFDELASIEWAGLSEARLDVAAVRRADTVLPAFLILATVQAHRCGVALTVEPLSGKAADVVSFFGVDP